MPPAAGLMVKPSAWFAWDHDTPGGLGLVWRRRGRAMLADGSDSLFDIYQATVSWDSTWRRTAVDEAECDPLVGMSLLLAAS